MFLLRPPDLLRHGPFLERENVCNSQENGVHTRCAAIVNHRAIVNLLRRVNLLQRSIFSTAGSFGWHKFRKVQKASYGGARLRQHHSCQKALCNRCPAHLVTRPALQKNFVNIFFVFAWEFYIEKWREFLVNFFWSPSPTKRSTKSPRKNRGKFGAKFGAKFGTKIRKIRETFVLQLFWPNTWEANNCDRLARLQGPPFPKTIKVCQK